MCGIVGIFDLKRRVDKYKLEEMRDSLSHRGPDDKGVFVERGIGLAHRRLSIIDLSKKGKQPMNNENNDMWMVFNGEIYNFRSLRNDLKKKGHSFKSDTDTEVVIHAYEEYGVDCLKKFKGMFALAIWDSKKRRLFLARDRLGIKPLYYYRKKGRLIFASEMKAILEAGVEREVNKKALAGYFSNLCVEAPQTILKNVYKLLPGHYLLISKEGSKGGSYWDLDYGEERINFNEAKDLMVDNLRKSVKERLVSDVPLGAFLSGGLDSSSIVALMSEVSDKVRTFSVGFEGQEDELGVARKVANKFNTEHHEYEVKPAEFDLFPKLIYYADEPFADDSIIPTYMVSKIARKKVKVCLSGDGGDENFAGYDRYWKNKVESYYSKLPLSLRRVICGFSSGRMKRISRLGLINDDVKRFVEGNKKFLDSEKRQLLNFNFREKSKSNLPDGQAKKRLNKLLYLDVKTTLPNLFLTKVDRASMMNGLEVRVPFLDDKFMEFTAKLPVKYKMKGLKGKYILRKAMEERLPEEVVKGKKKGFSAPVSNWLKGELKGKLKEIIFSSVKRGYFNKSYVEKLWRQHQEGRVNHQQRLWSLVSFELWSRIYLDKVNYKKVL